MAKSTEIMLIEPFDHHQKLVTSIVLEEPSGALFADVGDPRILVRSGEGGYYVEQPDKIRRYLDSCLKSTELGSDILSMLGLVDVMRLKQELFAFFADAEARIFAIERKTSSSA